MSRKYDHNKASGSRRNFLKQFSAVFGGAAVTPAMFSDVFSGTRPAHSGDQTFQAPLSIASGFNGEPAVQKAVELMQNGSPVLDAIIEGVKIQEEDPDDMTVGYGGRPNEKGVVQLGAGVMNGPTHTSGAVSVLEDTMYPSSIAKLVMQRSDHAILVGEGAKRFARMHGFKEQNLLTEQARRQWLQWKESQVEDDNYFTPEQWEGEPRSSAATEPEEEYFGTIHCSGLNANGNIAAVTSTSGLSYKIPGRVADSPIAGAGYYCDNEVGAAGSTGRGEANLQNLSSFFIVERMRMGDSPEQACLKACERIADRTRLKRLQDEYGDPNFSVRFYALNRDGQVGSAELRRRDSQMVVADPTGVHWVDVAWLLD